MTTIKQAAPEVRVAPQFPPVPGNVPPLNENGATKPAPASEVAANPPPLVSVKILSLVAPTAKIPKSNPGESEMATLAGVALSPE